MGGVGGVGGVGMITIGRTCKQLIGKFCMCMCVKTRDSAGYASTPAIMH